MKSARRVAVLALFAAALAGCGARPTYDATIYRSEGGVPHIVAGDFASLGFGTAYAVAEDNICLLARHFLRLDASLSEHLGPGDGNLESDLFYQLMKDTGRYAQDADPEFEALFRGYAAGYNRYLRDTGVGRLPDPSCRGRAWVRAITPQDSRNAHLNPFFLYQFLQMIVAATPPGAPAPTPAGLSDKGSNGVAIGRRGAAEGRALLFANPHLDWIPDQRFYPLHQIIPGELNLLGANQLYRASVGVGTNGHVAWTNTVSTGRRFTFYELELVPGDPTSYLFDGEPRKMQRHRVTVRVKNADGSMGEHSRDFYRTHFGFLIGSFPWNTGSAFVLRLADEQNRGINGATSEAYQARTVHELLDVHRRYQYMTVNLVAADSNGEVLYGDLGPVPNLDDMQLADCTVFHGRALDGSRSECQWRSDTAAAAAGILPPARLPSLIRDDFVTNSNDSYWLANPAQPLSGYPRILGRTGTERTLRTRSGLNIVQQRLDGSDGRPGRGFTLDGLVDVLLGNRSMAGELLRDDLVVLCRASPAVTLPDGEAIGLARACDVLADWDLHANLDSRGAHLFREFLREANRLAGPTDWPRILPSSLAYRQPFDVARPVATPYGLDTADNPNALLALGLAVHKLDEAGIALDARLGDIQGTTSSGEFIPLHGGPEIEGVFNKMEFDFAGAGGYPDVTGSSASWVMAVALGDGGPRAKGVLSYSLSANPASPHHADMTRMFSRKRLLDLPYRLSEVRRAALGRMELSEGASDCRGGGWRRYVEPVFRDEQHCCRHFESTNALRLPGFVTGVAQRTRLDSSPASR